MITIDEVNGFLDEFKVKAKVFGIIYRDAARRILTRSSSLVSLLVYERGLFSPWKVRTTRKDLLWKR